MFDWLMKNVNNKIGYGQSCNDNNKIPNGVDNFLFHKDVLRVCEYT